MRQVPEISPEEFVRRWPDWAGSDDIVLLDVREPAELTLAAIEPARHVPMGDVPAKLEELDKSKAIVVMCHSGLRSRRVAEFLLANGFKRVANLSGGIDAWSTQLDPNVPHY